VDYCGRSVSREPTPQYAAFAALRDALNKTGREIYYSICPHAVCPATGTGAPYHKASVYSPPAVWTAAQRHQLANSLLVEYTNTFDLWYADPVPRGERVFLVLSVRYALYIYLRHLKVGRLW
jgi:hypothetical protein